MEEDEVNDGPHSLASILERFQNGTNEQAARDERAYRRGFHQAWESAIDEMFALLDSEMSVRDAYAICAIYVNQVSAWRAEHPEGFIPPPSFNKERLTEALQRHRERKEAS